MMEDNFYNHQGKERFDFLCHSLNQLTSNNDHINEQEFTVFENQLEQQLDSIQMKSCVAEKSIYELSKVTKCYEYHKKDHVFFDPIAEYMEAFYSPVFQFHFHYEDQIHYKLPWSS